MKQPLISNLILRIEGTETNPHADLENVSTLKEKIYIKEYDVFQFNNEKEILNAILNAAEMASKIKAKGKYIHISMQHEIFLLKIPPCILNVISESGCTIELH